MTTLDVAGLPKPPAWTVDALCAQVDNDGFFPDKAGAAHAAKRVCARCTVTVPCLEYALAFESGELGTATSYGPFGVYGGLSPSERKQIIRDRQAAS